MNSTGIAVTFAFLLGWGFMPMVPAAAQPGPELRNPMILIDYYEPRSQPYQRLYRRMQDRKILENLSQFLAPVKWPKTLRLIMKECASAPRPELYYTASEYSLSICYELFTSLEALRPPSGFAARQEVIVGGLVGVVLHESARALLDMLNIPRLGSESDAADQISAFAALQFGGDIARVVIKGTYYLLKTYDEAIVGRGQYDFSANTSVPKQRMLNILCVAYGSPLDTFKAFVDQGDLLSRRAENCVDEYRHVQFAFDKTVTPHVDREMMKKVQSTIWIGPDDLQ